MCLLIAWPAISSSLSVEAIADSEGEFGEVAALMRLSLKASFQGAPRSIGGGDIKTLLHETCRPIRPRCRPLP